MIAVAVAAVWSTKIVVSGWEATHAPPPVTRTFTANALVKRHLPPEAISWQLTVTVHRPEQGAAQHELVAAVARARELLAHHGISPDEISLGLQGSEADTRQVIHHTRDGDTTEDVPQGFMASQPISVRSTDVARVLHTYRELAAIELGPVILAEPTCTLAGADDAERALAAEVRAQLRVRALAAVEAMGGSRLGKLVTADTGSVGTRTPQFSSCEHGDDLVAQASATYALE